MCLAQGPQRSDAGKAQTRGPSVSSQAIYHRATALPISYRDSLAWGNKSLSNGPGHMTKMAATPIYGKKNFKNLPFKNQKANDLGIWYEALGMLDISILFKWWS